jgi:hypothetical protein
MSAAPRHRHQRLNHKSSRFSSTMHKTRANEPWRSFHGKPSNSKRLLLTLSHASTHFFAIIKIRVGRQSKTKQLLGDRWGGKKGGQDKDHKAQHRKFPMNLGGIFSICLVLFVGSFKLYRLELSMLGSPQKENATVFAGPSMCLSEYSVPSVCHPVMRVPQVQHQILQSECHSCFHRTPFCAPISLILVEWQSSLFCCLHRQHKL